ERALCLDRPRGRSGAGRTRPANRADEHRRRDRSDLRRTRLSATAGPRAVPVVARDRYPRACMGTVATRRTDQGPDAAGIPVSLPRGTAAAPGPRLKIRADSRTIAPTAFDPLSAAS